MTPSPRSGLRIFLSHSSKDNNFGVQLIEDLRRTLADETAVWYDSQGGLLGGDAWWRKIMQELKACNVFIVVLSPDSMRSPWVNDEIDTAWRLKNSPSKMHIIPVLYRSCEVRPDLENLQIISFLPPKTYEEAFKELLLALGLSTEVGIKRTEEKGAQSVKKQGIPRRAIIAGLAGLAVAGSGLTWLALAQRPQLSSPSFRSTPTPKPTPTHTSIPPTTTATLLTYRGHKGHVYGVAWSPDGRYIASTGNDKTVQVWDPHVNIGPSIPKFEANLSGWGGSVTWSPDGKFIATGDFNNFVSIWDWQAKSLIFAYDAFHQLRCVAWSPNGNYLAFASINDVVQVLDVSNVWRARLIKTYVGHIGAVNGVAWSTDSSYLASASKDKTVRVWKAPFGNLIGIYPGHTDEVYAVAWASNAPNIVSASCDATVQVWNAFTQKEEIKYNFPSPKLCIRGVNWSPDGNYIVAASWNGKVEVWKLRQNDPVFTYAGHTGAVSTVAWSPDGKHIASGSDDQTVQIWQLK